MYLFATIASLRPGLASAYRAPESEEAPQSLSFAGGVLKKGILPFAVAAVVLPPTAAEARTFDRLLPRIAHIKDVRSVGGGRVVFHVAVGPKPGGLYDLEPVLSNNSVTGVETVSQMQRRLLPRANVVGVNGDLFGLEMGDPSGIFVRRGILLTTPQAQRPSLAIGVDGLLRIGRISYAGTFRIGAARVRTLKQFNRTFLGENGFGLYTRSWGPSAPIATRTNELILRNLGRTFPNRNRVGEVVRRVKGSGHRIPDGGAILQARGKSRSLLNAKSAPGLAVTVRLGLIYRWNHVEHALGGGPMLVRGGVAMYRFGNQFTWSFLNERHPRTAVGQRRDGRIVLLVADGRSTLSSGLTMNQLADAMVHYGAVRAMALDGGGSSEMAFNGNVLSRPSDGYERGLANSLQLVYIGAYARKLRHRVFSPNEDGYHDRQRLYAKFVRRSDVHLQLFRPDGELSWQRRETRSRGVLRKDLGPHLMMEGTWRWVVAGTDEQGRDSRMVRRFRVNNTLGFLHLSKQSVRVRRRTGGHLGIGFRTARAADIRVVIERSGNVVRHLVSGDGLAPGADAVIWNGRNDRGKVVHSGKFTVVVNAVNSLGQVGLAKRFSVERVS